MIYIYSLRCASHDKVSVILCLERGCRPGTIDALQGTEVFGMVQKETWHSMNEAEQDELRQVQRKFPLLMVWQMFFVCREAEDALKRLVSKDTFPHTSAPLTQAPEYRPAVIDLPHRLMPPT